MSSISKLSDECQKCAYKDVCDNKRMMACALIEKENDKLIPNKAVGLVNPLSNPIANTATSITIHMGELGNINTTMENIKEQLEKQFRINVCGFNKKAR